jgi:cytochrome P450
MCPVKNLPDWAPGAGFKAHAREWRKLMESFVDVPFAWTRSQIAAGTAVPSFISTILESSGAKMSAEEEFDLKWTSNSMYSASLDTSSTTIAALLLNLLSNPVALHTAQAELDAVVGPNRLPGFEDRESLPYVDALLSETFRVGAPVPLGLPHRLSEDDEYEGCRIPKGSLVFVNGFNMSRDARTYPEPETFAPERFLNLPEGKRTTTNPTGVPAADPRAYVFGAGRRRCPGMHIVEDSLWLLLATLLHAFDVLPEVDAEGQELARDVKYENPVFRTPSHFPMRLVPRKGRMALVDDMEVTEAAVA